MNLPIEMLCVCGTDGNLSPLRFRIEDEEHRLQTVVISQVLCSKPIRYVGVEAIQYLCKAESEGKERLFELRYTLQTHAWTVFRMVY